MRNQHGFSLVQILVAVGIAGIVIYALTTQISNMQNSNRVMRLQMSRDHLVREAVLSLSHGPTLEKSALLAENSAFLLCKTGGPAPDSCIAKRNGVRVNHEITIVSPASASVLSTGKGRYYDAGGSPCGDPSASSPQDETSCAMKLVTSFRAVCPGDLDECVRADSIEFGYEVQFTDRFLSWGPLSVSTGSLPYAPVASAAEASAESSTPPTVGRMSCFGAGTGATCCIDMGTKIKCMDVTRPSGGSFGMFGGGGSSPKSFDTNIPNGKWEKTGPYKTRATGGSGGAKVCLGALSSEVKTGDDCTVIGEECVGTAMQILFGGFANSSGQFWYKCNESAP